MTSAQSRVVFLTGAAGGIGLAMTEALLAADHRVAAVDRDAKALDRLSARHAKSKDRLHPILADLANAAGCEQAVPRHARVLAQSKRSSTMPASA